MGEGGGGSREGKGGGQERMAECISSVGASAPQRLGNCLCMYSSVTKGGISNKLSRENTKIMFPEQC